MKFIIDDEVVLSRPLEGPLAMKEKALGKTKSLEGKFKRYRPGDQLLGFLNNL